MLADGLQYPGLLALADGHGRYLYDQFAREFFVNNPDVSPASLEFDAARYDGRRRARRTGRSAPTGSRR